jgi:hypothetical protein
MERKISEGEVNEFYITHLNDLNRKMNYVKAKNADDIEAIKDVGKIYDYSNHSIYILCSLLRFFLSPLISFQAAKWKNCA